MGTTTNPQIISVFYIPDWVRYPRPPLSHGVSMAITSLAQQRAVARGPGSAPSACGDHLIVPEVALGWQPYARAGDRARLSYKIALFGVKKPLKPQTGCQQTSLRASGNDTVDRNQPYLAALTDKRLMIVKFRMPTDIQIDQAPRSRRSSVTSISKSGSSAASATASTKAARTFGSS